MKKLLCMFLTAAILCTSLPQTTLAADFATAQQTVKALGILSDVSSAHATRAEFAKMLVSASAFRDETGDEGVSSLYKDVSKSHWAAEYIRIAVEKGWMVGNVSGLFRPEDSVRVEEAATSLLELLGYEPASLAGTFPNAQISKAKALGLADGVTFSKGRYLTKQDCMYLFYNLMNAKTAEGSVYAAAMGYSLSGDTLNYSSVVSEELKGPFVLENGSNLFASLPFTVSGSAVYRNGALATAADAQAYDVYYYNEDMQTVWLYSNHVTGTYSAASPNATTPETVTVAGSTYAVETSAAYKLSTLGEYKIGDVVTLLIGMDGSAVDVVSTDKYSGSYYGLVVDTGVNSYIDATGASRAEEAIYVTCTDGVTRTFTTDKDLEVGDMVSVTFSGSKQTVTKLSRRTMAGNVSKDGEKFGSLYDFASDVRIINVSQDNTAQRIYPSKLAGHYVSGSQVWYYLVNSSSEITDLILYNAVGEGSQYGIITSIDVKETGTDSDGEKIYSYTYQYIMDGTSGTVTISDVDYGLRTGPAYFRMKDGAWQPLSNLVNETLNSVDYLTAYSSDKKYSVSEEVQCYVKTSNKTYTLVNISTMKDADRYRMTGYIFDDVIHMIIAEER